jgi:3-carboxy-cis,cis-muconate cycloisomerase
MTTGMYDSFITGHWFSHEAKCIWSDFATLQAWLDVESALARAQSELRLVPPEAAARIASMADASLFDLSRLAENIALAEHSLVPVLHELERLCGEPAAGYIHLGATTQNIFDTATSLQMFESHRLLVGHLDAAIEAFSRLALQHQGTAMAGRTHGQHALPMTLGFKLAGWVDELDRARTRLCARLKGSFTASMGGAIGTFAALGPVGRAVETKLAELLGLEPTGLPLRSSYDRVGDYATSLGLLASTAQKIAQDVVFMQRTEVAEVSEEFHMGKVGSSTMAQKRNPSTALLLVSLARMLRARVPLAMESMVRMDEGDSSCTNVTDALIPEMAIIAASVARTLARLAQGLVVHPQALQCNLALTEGLIAAEAVMMKLTQLMGRHQAHQLLYEASQQVQSEGVPFLTAIGKHPLLADRPISLDLQQAMRPEAYVGESQALTVETINRVLGQGSR